MKQNMAKHILAAVTAGILTIGTVSGAVFAADEPELDPDLTIHLGQLTSHVLGIVAETQGFFEEEGVNVELVSFAAGPPEIEAYTSGDLDIVQTGDLPFLNGVLNGVDLQAIGTYSVSDTINGLVVRDDADIKELADLKGKQVSVPFGTNIQPLLYEYLEIAGLTEDDIELINLQNADAVNALVAGDIQAAVLWDPFLTQAANSEGLTQIADTTDIRTFVCPISSSTEFLEAHPEEVKALLRALNKASEWSKENIDEAAQIVSDYFEADNADAVRLSIEKTDSTVALTQDKIDALVLGAAECYKFGLIEEEVDILEHVQPAYTADLAE